MALGNVGNALWIFLCSLMRADKMIHYVRGCLGVYVMCLAFCYKILLSNIRIPLYFYGIYALKSK